MLWRYRLPSLVMPVAVTLWYTSTDLAPVLAGGEEPDWNLPCELRKLVSLRLGLMTALLAFWVDLRGRRGADYAFWPYLFGVAALWGGMTMMESDSERARFG